MNVQHSNSSLQLFEILARFFCDQYYNILFVEANKRRNNSKDDRSITECYCDVMLQYLAAFRKNSSSNKEYYNMIWRQLNSYFNEVSGKNMDVVGFTEYCLNNIMSEELASKLSNNMKDLVTFNVMSDIMSSFTHELKNNLRMVIDVRDKDNYDKIKSIFVAVILAEKDDLYQRYVGIVTNGQPARSEEIGTIASYRKELKLLHEKHADLRVKYNELLALSRAMAAKLKSINTATQPTQSIQPTQFTFQPTPNQLVSNQPASNRPTSSQPTSNRPTSSQPMSSRPISAQVAKSSIPIPQPSEVDDLFDTTAVVQTSTPASAKSIPSTQPSSQIEPLLKLTPNRKSVSFDSKSARSAMPASTWNPTSMKSLTSGSGIIYRKKVSKSDDEDDDDEDESTTKKRGKSGGKNGKKYEPPSEDVELNLYK